MLPDDPAPMLPYFGDQWRQAARWDALFRSSGDGRRDSEVFAYAKPIVRAISGGLVKVTMTDVCLPTREISPLGGGRDHQELGESAAAWLWSIGERHALIEHSCWIGRPDLFGRDTRTIVECGDTTVRKCLEALAAGWRFALFPFWSPVAVVLFEAEPAGVAALKEHLEEQRWAAAREMVML